MRIEIDAEKADAGEKWSQATALLTQCSPVDVKVWYAFGSTRLDASPSGKSCQVALEIEIELDRRFYRCTLRPKPRWTWNLVFDAKGPRKAPQRDLPADLAPLCRTTRTFGGA
ncbi:MAG: hypothetical protein M3O46_10650 [Myxococcota bacterium]|nr:hypothetical protein [Myxococcota bacterium]